MAIFPIVEETTIQEDIIQDRGINFLFDFRINDFILKDGKFIELTGDAAVVFWIEKTLRTEYEKATVYNYTGYGTRLEEYRGKVLHIEIVKNIFETNIKSSLLKHERINSINNFNVVHEDEELEISFEITLNPLTEIITGIYGSEEGFTRLNTLEDIKKFLGIKLLTNNSFYFKTNIGNQVYLNI